MRVIFNPSMPYRFTHMLLACYLATAMLVAAVGAYHLLRDPDHRGSRLMLRMSMPFIALVASAQIIAGHEQGGNVYEYQPVKLAAMEGHWQTYRGDAPLILFAWPDQRVEENRWELSLPALGSLVVTGSFDGAIRGLKHWSAAERPPVAVVFWSFRLMVGLGLLMLAIGVTGSWLLWRGALYRRRGFLRLCVLAAPSGLLAVLAGWVTAEVGRQPYVVQGLLRTAEAASPVSGGAVGLSLIVYGSIYTAVFGAGLYYMLGVVRRGVDAEAAPTETTPRKTRLAGWFRRSRDQERE